jgi:hypothetical protein
MPIHDVLKVCVRERRRHGVPYTEQDETDLLNGIPNWPAPNEEGMKVLLELMQLFESSKFGLQFKKKSH